MSNNFNKIAPFYDLLSFLVFGRDLYRSQMYHLGILQPNQRILIAGGGTGKILNALNELNCPLQVDYIEKSAVMINKAKRRAPFKYLKVEFIDKDIFEMDLPNYDVVITNYFLDVFQPEQLQRVMKKLASSLSLEGDWIFTDFKRSNHFISKLLLKVMYLFFRFTTRLEADKLPDFENYFLQLGLRKEVSRCFYFNFIESAHYKFNK